MATTIISISFNNFYNYYGEYEVNIYEFNKGLNVVVADNGAGKSKLFNGFSWILKDKVFDSDLKRYVKIEDSALRMICDRAKNETAVKSDVKCGVRLVFQDDEFEYEIEKVLYATRIKSGSITKNDNWDCEIEDVKIARKDIFSLSLRDIYDKDLKEEIIRKIIRPDFQQYALLQGEEVDKILDFGNKGSLNDAIRTLSNIGKIERLIPITKYLAKKGEDELFGAQKREAKDKKEFEKRIEEKDGIEKQIKRKKAELSRKLEKLTKAKEERNNLVNFITNAQDREKIRGEIKNLTSNLERVDKDHGEFLDSLNDRFFDEKSAWLLLGANDFGEKFAVLRDHYLDQMRERSFVKRIGSQSSEFLTRLPKGSPEIYSLKSMIKQEECFVCGRPAQKGSEEYAYIKKVLESHETPAGMTNSMNQPRFRTFFDFLLTKAQSYHNQISDINKDVELCQEKDVDFRKRKAIALKKRGGLQNDLSGLGGSGANDDDEKVRKYGGAERSVEKLENEINRLELEVAQAEFSLIGVKKEIDNLSGTNVSKGIVRRKEITQDLHKIAINTKERIFQEIIEKLENAGNEYFRRLTKENAVRGGEIRILPNLDQTYAIEIRDPLGNKVYGLSEGFQRMKKLAVIMAIIASSERGKLDYPLIADAPISTFGKGFIKGFFDEVPEVFHQSIVMVKDLYDNTSSNFLSDLGEAVLDKIRAKPGSFHLNEIVNQDEQLAIETKIHRY